MKKILIIDDDAGVLSLLGNCLQKAGYQVRTAADGAVGLSLLHDERPDAVLLDVVMPVLDGHTVLREMKADALLKDVPVLILTSKSELEDLFQIEGACAFLIKPIQPQEVLNRLAELLV